MKRVFTDTSYWFSLAVRADGNHQRTLAFTAQLQEQGVLLCLSPLIISETHRLILYKLGIEAGQRFLAQLFKEIETKFVEVIPVGWSDLTQARVLINRYHDQDLSLTDTCSAVLMRRNNISQIASYDRHFTVLQFEMLP
jgi:predicted nucleic acid-binding protein